MMSVVAHFSTVEVAQFCIAGDRYFTRPHFLCWSQAPFTQKIAPRKIPLIHDVMCNELVKYVH